MVKRTRKVIIENYAKEQLRDAYNYIKIDSPQKCRKG